MLTFVIPTAPYHEAIVQRAVASCLAQTLTCSVVVVYDHDRRGTGWARNQGLRRVQTPFVTFLDADDTLEPTFAEDTLRAYEGRHYVYTDWVETDVKAAPDCPWRFGTHGADSHHIVTALVPTAWARYVGGFDEQLPGDEDGEFYMHLTRAGLCGRRLAKPLVHYHDGGLRARKFIFGDTSTFGAGEHFERVVRIIRERYGEKPMPCCGENENFPDIPLGEAQPGDVLAKVLWMGNHRERGSSTGRLYPRTGNGATLWVHPNDIDAAPHLFARVVEMPPALDDAAIEQFRRVTGQVLGVKDAPYEVPGIAPQVASAPDVGRVLRLYDQRVHPQGVNPAQWADDIPR